MIQSVHLRRAQKCDFGSSLCTYGERMSFLASQDGGVILAPQNVATRSFPGLVKVTSAAPLPQAPQKASRHSKEASGSAGTRLTADVTVTSPGKFRGGKIFCPKMWRRGASQGS